MKMLTSQANMTYSLPQSAIRNSLKPITEDDHTHKTEKTRWSVNRRWYEKLPARHFKLAAE